MSIMHKTIAVLIVGAGIFAGSMSASAASLTSVPGAVSGHKVENAPLQQVHYRRYGHHDHWRRHHHRGPSIYFGFGPRWGYRHHWRHRHW